MIISERIFCVMEQKNITQLELSRRTGIATSNISDWKKKKTNPKADCLLSICDALEITPEQLFLQKKYEDIGNKFSKSNVVLTVSVNFSGLVPEWEEIAATAMAVQNMHLTCAANNVGAYWGTPGMKDYLGKFLQLEENQKCYGLFFMGMIQN